MAMILDYSECAVEAIPEHISIKLPDGVVVKFSVPKMSSKAPAKEPFKAPAKEPFKKAFNRFEKSLCGFGLTCHNKNCTYDHPDLETEKQAIFKGSPEKVHDYIHELFEKLDEKRLKIFLHAMKYGKFAPFQDDCPFGNECTKGYCARIHNEYDVKGVSDEALEAINEMGYRPYE